MIQHRRTCLGTVTFVFEERAHILYFSHPSTFSLKPMCSQLIWHRLKLSVLMRHRLFQCCLLNVPLIAPVCRHRCSQLSLGQLLSTVVAFFLVRHTTRGDGQEGVLEVGGWARAAPRPHGHVALPCHHLHREPRHRSADNPCAILMTHSLTAKPVSELQSCQGPVSGQMFLLCFRAFRHARKWLASGVGHIILNVNL